MRAMVRERPAPNVDRLSVFIGVIVLTPVLVRFVNVSPQRVDFSVLGSPVSFEMTGTWLTVAMVTTLSAMGANAVIRTHPRMSQPAPPRTFTFWILPGLTGLIAALLLERAQTWPLWWAGLLLTGLAIALVVLSEFATVDAYVLGFARSRLILNVVAYTLAFISFTLIYGTRGRSVITASAVSLVGLVLAFELLNTTEVSFRRTLLYALLTALLLGETAWALNYWQMSGVAGGLIMLLVFYTIVGVVQQLLLDRLTRRTLAEFAVVAAIAFVLILRLNVQF
jgi:hypothetical protein